MTSLKQVSASVMVRTLARIYAKIEVTLAAVKKELSLEEHEKATRGEGDVNMLEITASDFIIAGIELEEQQ